MVRLEEIVMFGPQKLALYSLIFAALVVSGCGQKTVNNGKPATAPTAFVSQPVTPAPETPTTPTTPTTPSGGGSSPLSYEINLTGGSAVFQTTPINTDNVLRVRYEVGPAGNQLFDATDVRVEISVNGSTRVPKYVADGCPSGGCEYGRPSDGPSTILDFSGNLQPGVPVTIRVTNAQYNWYCYTGLYPGGIPQYNYGQTCNYRLVQNPQPSIGFPGHYWRGRLIVQTNATNVSQFQSANP